MGVLRSTVIVALLCLVGYLKAGPLPRLLTDGAAPDQYTDDAFGDHVEEILGSDSSDERSSLDWESILNDENSESTGDEDTTPTDSHEQFPDYPYMDQYEQRVMENKCPMFGLEMCEMMLDCSYEDRVPTYFKSSVDGELCRGCMKCKDDVEPEEGTDSQEGSEKSPNNSQSGNSQDGHSHAEDSTSSVAPRQKSASTTTLSSSTTQVPTKNVKTISTASSTSMSSSTTTTNEAASTTTLRKSKPDLSVNGPDIPQLGRIIFPAFPKTAIKFISHSLNMQNFDLQRGNLTGRVNDVDQPEVESDPQCPSLDCMSVEQALPCDRKDMVTDMMLVRAPGSGVMIRCEVCRKCKEQQ